MIAATIQAPRGAEPAAEPTGRAWLPPRSMRRYQQAKAGGGLLFIGLFAGWLVLQWSNPVMRWTILGLLAVTAWVTISSIVTDRRRARDRQLVAEPGRWTIHAGDQVRTVALEEVAEARWRHDDPNEIGLWLHGRDGRVLGRLDDALVGDEEEARRFLGWARGVSGVPFPVRWPGASDEETGAGRRNIDQPKEGLR